MTLDVYGHLMKSDLGDAALRVDALLSNDDGKVIELPKAAESD
jgi:hypothetical protein